MKDSCDLVVRAITTAAGDTCAIFYLPQVVDIALLSQFVVQPLQRHAADLNFVNAARLMQVLQYEKTEAFVHMGTALSTGTTVLLIEGANEALLLKTAKFEARSVERPETEDVIIGPHEGFTESLMTNLGILRLRLQTPEFKIKFLTLGRQSRTTVAVMYLENIAEQELVNEVEARLKKVDIDVLYGAAYLTDFIEDEPASLFPLVRITERPDRVIAALAEGRVAVLADGGPNALVAPAFLPEYLQSSEDYYEKPLVATSLRLLRLLSLIITILFPGVWVAFTGFHHGILPKPLLTTIVTGREQVPLTVVIEMFLMLIAFDIIIEASTRLPRLVGQAISIVGALVIGQAAVQANLVAPPTIIVVAMTGLANYALPSPAFVGSARLLKYLILAAGSVLGLYGVILALIVLIVQAASLRSFGYSAMFPLGPLNLKRTLDVLFKPLNSNLRHSSKLLSNMDSKQMKADDAPDSANGGT